MLAQVDVVVEVTLWVFVFLDRQSLEGFDLEGVTSLVCPHVLHRLSLPAQPQCLCLVLMVEVRALVPDSLHDRNGLEGYAMDARLDVGMCSDVLETFDVGHVVPHVD